MRRLTRLQILAAVAVLTMVVGLAATQTVAEARRNPPTTTQRYRPVRTATPASTTTPSPVATEAATATPVPSATPTISSPAPTPTAAPTVGAAGPPAASPIVRFSDNFEGLPAGMTWNDGEVHGNWVDVFNGYGTAGIVSDGDQVFAQSPKASVQPGETHAALAVTATRFSDVDLTLQMRTVSQLRTGSAPNPWETAWTLWNYTDNTHFYYLVLKPGGFEIGKEDPAYPGAQRFLVTHGNLQFPIGRWYAVHVKQAGNTFTVWVDGVQLAQFTDNERPYTSGAIGLYSEDASVHFNDVVVQ